MSVTIRKATEDDTEIVYNYIRQLAEYKNMSNICTITISELYNLLFDEKSLRALIVENSGEAVGMATYFYFRVSAFSGKRVLYIEDMFIEEKFRAQGIGTHLFEFLRTVAKERNCLRMEWKCLNWDSPTISFYEKMGGRISDGWLTYTLESEHF
ncbi:MAG: GNAT family N-acetyltransferase [Oscillospiraceae bacterium]|nr:GNAT family N-acetyltransferase [Oscillospiraceae bacterium]